MPPPSSPPSTVGRPKGLLRSPQSSALCVMQIAMQLCPQTTAAWRCNPRLPSRACKFSSTLTAKAYGAAGQAASALQDCDCSVTTAAFTMAAAWSWPQESGAARLRPCQACEAPGQAASLRLHHSFPRRRAGWKIFLFCSTTGSGGKKNSKKIAVSFFSGSQEGEDGSARDTVSTLLSPSPFASGQQGPV